MSVMMQLLAVLALVGFCAILTFVFFVLWALMMKPLLWVLERLGVFDE